MKKKRIAKKKKVAAKRQSSAPPAGSKASASDLIAAAQTKQVRHPLPPEGVEYLREVVEYNDTLGHQPYKAVGSNMMVTALQRHFGWTGTARGALNTVCRHYLGRDSFGSKHARVSGVGDGKQEA